MGFIGAAFFTILVGIFGILVWIAIILIICAIVFIFIPCLIIAIVNLVKGIKNKWPKRNIIPLAITGPISVLFIIAMLIFLMCAICFMIAHPDGTSSSSSVQFVSTVNLLLL